MLGLLEDKGEGVVEFLVRTEPNVLAGAHFDVGLKHIGVGSTHPRIRAVSTNDQVVIGVSGDIFGFCLKFEFDPERERTLLKDAQ